MLTVENLQSETGRTCRTTAQLQARYADLKERAHSLTSNARRQGRDTSGAERVELSALLAEADRIGSMPTPEPYRDQPDVAGQSLAPAAGLVDQHGHRLHALRPNERFTDLPLPDNKGFHPLSIGKAIVGLATGQWANARAERLAMAEGGNAAGGYLVGEAFSKSVIDAARAQARVVQAGAITIPWENSDTLSIARVESDPTFKVVAENTLIPESSVTFGRVQFSAYKIACLLSLSRELAEDAPNAAQLVEQILTKSFAVELDRLALVGSGSAEPNGLLNYTGVESTDSIGAIEWEDLHAAAVEVRGRNFEPTGYICSPTIAGDLDLITSGDGTNAAKMWLGPPPSLTQVPRYSSTNCPNANLFVGDWTQMAIALRTDATIEATTSGGNAFEKHQLLIKLTFRGDFGCLHSGAFHVLKGITT